MGYPVSFRSVRLGPKATTLIVFGVSLFFCPWIWKPLPDGYFGYSGFVVEKGLEHHIFTAGRRSGDAYIVIRQPDGKREKKYVGDFAYAIISTGTFVVKKRGLQELPLRPDQTDPRDILNR